MPMHPNTRPSCLSGSIVALALAAALALLHACGGGGDAPSADSQPPASAADSDATCDLANFSAQVLARVNAARSTGRSCGAQGAFGPAQVLAWNDLLASSASAHSLDMAAQNYFSHTSLDGRTFVQRVDATGYAWQRLAENIAAGPASVQQAVDGWLASDGHCANIMDPALRDIGTACAPGTAATAYRTYWTMDLGAAR